MSTRDVNPFFNENSGPELREDWLDDTVESLAPAQSLWADVPEPEFEGFKLSSLAGEGSFGLVYRAWDETLDREVAIKVLRETVPDGRSKSTLSPRDRLLNEARALARVRHENVPVVYSILEPEPGIERPLALVTEFIDGVPLSEVLEARGAVEETEAAAVAIELCRALAAVHDAGILHRDLKTDNVLREVGGRIVLMDFGISLPLDEEEAFNFPQVAGSPLFMAPEQIRGRGMGPWTDVYGVGVVLYNLSSASYPVVSDNIADLVRRVRAGAIVPLSSRNSALSPDFVNIVSRCLERDPVRRYQGVGELENDLRTLTRPLVAA